jgi:xanthine dehydrogenase YagR molybdenum-binding subunit
MNPRTARSQLMGGLIWGMSSALLEATELDERYARYINDNLADYTLPVNTDAPRVEVILLSEVDEQIDLAGVKGLGELGDASTNAAIYNAIFNATGQRIRKLHANNASCPSLIPVLQRPSFFSACVHF